MKQLWNNDEAKKFVYNPLEVSEQISEYTLPSEILVYQPTEDDIFTKFHPGSHQEFKIRQIFLNVELLEDEEAILIEFDNYLSKKNITIPEFMRSFLLRVLMFNKRRHPNNYLSRSVNHLINMFQWRVSTYPLSDLEENLRYDLNSGIIYWHGRDYSLRPILVIRLSKVHKTFPVDRFIRLIVFCMEWGMRYLMFPGKVETCLTLIDMKGVSLTSFPISTMSEISSLLTNQYSFRLYRMFILHDSFFVQTVWSLMKQFLTDLQQHKIILSRNDIRSQLFKTVHPNQVEEYFGGLQKNRTKPFYPFKFPKGPFADQNIHPSNGFTRYMIENENSMPDFTSINNCHILINQQNVLGELLYNGKKHFNMKWDENGLFMIKDNIRDVLKIDLLNDKIQLKSSNLSINGNDVSLEKLDMHCKVYESEEIQEVEKLESRSHLPSNQILQRSISLPYSTKMSKMVSSKNFSRDINIGIINTININSDIANIGDRSQHFIREYSVKSDSIIANNLSQIFEDTQSFFSASSNNCVLEELNNPQIEDFRNELVIDNQCYDHGVFQSFGVLPITRENFKYPAKQKKERKVEKKRKEQETNKQEKEKQQKEDGEIQGHPSKFLAQVNNNISPISDSTKSPTSDSNKANNETRLNKSQSMVFKERDIKSNNEHAHLTTSLIDVNPLVSSLNTSSRSISLENSNIQEKFKFSKKDNVCKTSRKSKLRSKVYRIFAILRNSKSSIDDSLVKNKTL